MGPDTEKEREPMDSLTNGTASLWQYDDRKRQLDQFCVTGVHSSVRYVGAKSFRQRWTVTAIRNWMRSGMSNQCGSCILVYVKPRSYFREFVITRASPLMRSISLEPVLQTWFNWIVDLCQASGSMTYRETSRRELRFTVNQKHLPNWQRATPDLDLSAITVDGRLALLALHSAPRHSHRHHRNPLMAISYCWMPRTAGNSNELTNKINRKTTTHLQIIQYWRQLACGQFASSKLQLH